MGPYSFDAEPTLCDLPDRPGVDTAAGTLPAGRYAVVSHIGHPDELVGVTAELLDWARQEGMTWDLRESPDGEPWSCRLEICRPDPIEQPDMARWEAELRSPLPD